MKQKCTPDARASVHRSSYHTGDSYIGATRGDETGRSLRPARGATPAWRHRDACKRSSSRGGGGKGSIRPSRLASGRPA
eukprot:170989-Prorocentrum_minimum.AAC.1